MLKYLAGILIFLYITAFSQDSTKSQAFKDNRNTNIYPLVKPIAPSYPLMAAYLLQKYANEDDPLAQHEIGLRHLLGKGFPRDTIKAVFWIQKAAEKNLTAAKFNYAIMLDNGIGTAWNPFAAFKNVKFAADAGMPEAQYFYGTFFTDNLVVNRDYSEAYRWFCSAAKSDFKPAIEAKRRMEEFGIASISLANDNASVNKTESDSSRENSSALFDPDYELDFFDFDNTNSDKVENVRNIYQKETSKLKSALGIANLKLNNHLSDSSGASIVEFAANSGSPEALLIIGKDFEFGVTRKKDQISAVENYIKAYRKGSLKSVDFIYSNIRKPDFFKILKEQVDKNNPSAMYIWAGLTALGFDYQITGKQALDLLEKAVKFNHTGSLIELGLLYYNGTFVDKDIEKAYSFWNKAADLGNTEAEVRLALTYIQNNSGNNSENFIKVLRDAADRGSVLAQSALAFCYETGLGIKMNKAEAVHLYRMASNRGSEVAYNSLKRMYDDVRPDEDDYKIFERL